MNRIFLTGEKQVGKSTIIAAWMKACPGRLGDFLTVQDYAFLPRTLRRKQAAFYLR